MTTTTLYNIIRHELINNGYNEFKDKDDTLLFFDKKHQVTGKILRYDDDISDIMENLFNGMTLNHPVYDAHFKKAFLMRFVNRQINRQTVEAFMMQLGYVFLNHEDYLNRVYEDMDMFLSQKSTSDQDNTQENNQTNQSDTTQRNKQNSQQETTGESTSDNRQARSDLPQNNVQIDVDNTIMTSAKENDISRNKDRNKNQSADETTGETVGNTKGKADSKTVGNTKGLTHSYRLDELFKINNILERVFNDFDRQCFMQVW